MKNRNKTTEKKGLRELEAAGLVLMALFLGACGQRDVSGDSRQDLGIPISDTESSSGGQQGTENFEAGSLSASAPEQSREGSVSADAAGNGEQSGSQPTYIGSWKVADYCYPTTPCGLSQLEVDILIGSELIYAQESFTCNQKVMQGEGFGYEFSFYDSLTEYEQDYNVSVDKWFADGDVGQVKCGYLTIEEDVFGNRFVWMEEQPDKMLIYYYGVIFLAVNDRAQADLTVGSPRENAYLEALKNLLFDQQLPLGQEMENIPVTVYFAIQDIDGDGREELLINYQGSVMAAIQEMVYDYDESKGELYREIWDFPDIKYMSNGYARSDHSHNHTQSDFWPYNLYRYNSSTDQYELAFIVTAWDRELAGTDAQGNPFPDAVDTSGTGRVFMIGDGLTGETSALMDTADYEKWYADTLGEYANAPTVVVWQLLAEENLSNL